jgi:general secretion pathway protein G
MNVRTTQLDSRRLRALTRSSLRGGFSLLELMLVLVIIGILIGAVAVSIGGTGTRAKTKLTKQALETVATGLKAYHLEYSAFPPTLDVLLSIKPPFLERAIKDAWDNPITYEPRPRGNEKFTLISPGEDKQIGTEDDIAYETAPPQ